MSIAGMALQRRWHHLFSLCLSSPPAPLFIISLICFDLKLCTAGAGSHRPGATRCSHRTDRKRRASKGLLSSCTNAPGHLAVLAQATGSPNTARAGETSPALGSGSSPGLRAETRAGGGRGSRLPWKGNEDIHFLANLVNYFCLAAQRKGLGRALSKSIVPGRKKKKKKKGMIKTCLEEFGSGSCLNRLQVSEAEASGCAAGVLWGCNPWGTVFGVVGWINSDRKSVV